MIELLLANGGFTSTCVGVGGGWIVQVSGGRPQNLVLVFEEWPVIMKDKHVLLAVSL